MACVGGPLSGARAQQAEPVSPEVAADIARVRAALADPNPRPLTVVTPADASLYRELGGAMGLDRLVDEMLHQALRDARLRPFFGDADLVRLKPQLVAQFCQLSGGPCRYEGPNMRKAHAGMDITKDRFNALVEVLQNAMEARAIPFAAQNRLLAQLAPLHRDIVNTP